MTIDPAMFWLLVGLAALSGALIGWDRAIHNHRTRQAVLETSVADLEEQVATFRIEEQKDPQRAWIDIGKKHVLHQMEYTVRKIRATFDPEIER